ncbi:hypothetical protein ABB37_01306 [Leptomonas pyrrhocoris]|uniref:Uncharacterized protein n=1 Tax=Leptomonas pyrrhocoris TaxID=157538 RepID=A0A0N0VH33_LEPPY|nr:hypothetical protein ABB37_01306 [Leptomonas pyrrhocoris]KPA84834.1 hypothetical protein ABB37_01306 [Leptomonas pyrrhocoris]|eukprot:XP_015663273.1 hypothetical protein ABB37_01306 [Leptomonas pyrrhocoris]
MKHGSLAILGRGIASAASLGAFQRPTPSAATRGAFNATIVQRRTFFSLLWGQFSESLSPGSDKAPASQSVASWSAGTATPLTTSGKSHHDVVGRRRGGVVRKEHQTKSSTSGDRTRASDASSQAPSYEFPVGRALRYVQQGQRFYLQAEGQAELHEWLATHDTQRGVNRKGTFNVAADTIDASSSPLPEVRGHEERVRNEVSKFTKYHAHHVLIAFKQLRRHLFQLQQSSAEIHRGDAIPRHAEGKNGKRRLLQNTSAAVSSPNLPSHDVDTLTGLLFAATVLLHLGGLFTVSDTHVEPLIELCFSATVFLAQDSTTTARLQGASKHCRAVPARHCTREDHAFPSSVQRRSSPTRVPRPKKEDETLAGETKPAAATTAVEKRYAAPLLQHRHLHSLHWSIVHFAAAVQRWGLLEHTSPLQSIQRTQRPYERLLQTHAALLCELTRARIDHVLWHELILLKSGQRAPASVAAWFFGADEQLYRRFFDRAGAEAATRVPPRLQQRRLQLLPMLWLSLLSSQLARCAESAHSCKTHGCAARTRDGDLIRQHEVVVFGGEMHDVNWGSARHAFTSLLPLFATDAGFEVTAWALLHHLFMPGLGSIPAKQDVTRASENASLTETCALVARVEQSDAALKLGNVLPFEVPAVSSNVSLTSQARVPAGSPSPTFDSRRRLSFHLACFLRRFLNGLATDEQETDMARRSVENEVVTHSMSSPPPYLSRTSKKSTRNETFLQYLSAPQTAIRRPVQLYRALLNIPLCSLDLPPAHTCNPPTEAAFPLLVTTDGVRLVNTLLLRVLVQWRTDAAQQRRLRAPSFHSATPRAASGAAKEREPATPDADEDRSDERGRLRAAATRAEWEREVFFVLQAVHHLSQLLSHATAADFIKGTGDSLLLGSGDGANAALQVALLVPTVQAAARALSEQLGMSLLPRRLALMADNGYSLRPTEQKLLKYLDEELRGVLVRRHSGAGENTTDDEVPEPSTGALPWSYKAALSALLNERGAKEVHE